MYANEHDANAFGFRAVRAARTVHQHAYPVACRFGYKVALALSIAAHVIARHA